MKCQHCDFSTASDSILRLHHQTCHKSISGTPGDTGVFFPEPDPHFMVSKRVAAQLKMVIKIAEKHPVNVLVTGFQGGGKTSLGIQLAASEKRPCVVVEVGNLNEASQWFQTTYLKETAAGIVTDTRPSAFVVGIETQGCVVILDEANRAETERVLNVLMPLLDERRKAWVEELRRNVVVAPRVIFIATLNEGAYFCGTNSIDTALRDRFREINLPYLRPEAEAAVLAAKTCLAHDKAQCLAQFGAKVRANSSLERKVSTRQLLLAAEGIGYGMSLWDSVDMALGNFHDAPWRQACQEILHTMLPKSEIAAAQKTDDGYVSFSK